MTKRVYLSIILIGVSLFGCTEHPQSEQSHLKHTRRIAHHGQHNKVWKARDIGEASFYGCTRDISDSCIFGDDHTQGQPMSSGVPFDTHKSYCASWRYKLRTWVKVMNLTTHKSAACRIMDRGPAKSTGRVIDLSYHVKSEIGMEGGLTKVVVFAQPAPTYQMTRIEKQVYENS